MRNKKGCTIKFVRVLCRNCKHDQILFTRASKRVQCFYCHEVLAMPKGGKCEIVGGTITERLQ